MKRFKLISLLGLLLCTVSASTALGDVLTAVAGCPPEYQNATVTVKISTDKYTYWGWDWYTGARIRITVDEWWATYKFSGLEPQTDYWLSGTTTEGQVIWLSGFMSDTGDYSWTNGGIYTGKPPRFAYFELWSDSTADPYSLGEPVKVLLSSQK